MVHCHDMHNQEIGPGMHFVPGPDSCTLCVCDNGSPKWCKAVLCSPPQNCKSFRVGNSCCEFICLDDTLGKSDSDNDFNAEIGLRLIATAITAILSLSLLFFLFHRLRQRKIRGRQDRELTEEERSLGSIGYIAGSLGYLPEHHFEEPTGHYPLWKPPGNSYYSRGEAPPPYEEALAAARAEAALARIPGPSVPSQLHAQHRTIPVNMATSGALLPGSPISHIHQTFPPPIVEPVPPQGREPMSEVVVEPKVEIVEKTSSSIGQQQQQQRTANGPPTIEENDDYRSECENCNMRQSSPYEEDLVTMTLHRRTEAGDPQFYRASLTLPSHSSRKQQSYI